MSAEVSGISIKWLSSEALLAKRLYEVGAIKFGSFEVKNPKLSPSPLYINLRTRSHPDPERQGPLGRAELSMIAMEIFRIVDENSIAFDFVCGVPNAGTPIAESFCDLISDKKRSYKCVMEKKVYGEEETFLIAELSGNLIKRGKHRLLLLDDVISGADTKLKAIEVAEKAGYIVSAVAVLVDREQGGFDELQRRGYRVVCWKKLTDLLWFYFNTASISLYRVEEVIDYISKNKI